MKIRLLFCILLTFSLSLQAQRSISYGSNGNTHKSVTDHTTLSIAKVQTGQDFVAAAVVGVALGPVYNFISSAIKNGLEKRKKSFTASYSNSSVFKKTSFGEQDNVLLIRRYAINELGGLKVENLMSTFTVRLKNDEGDLLATLESANMQFAKARYKAGDKLSIAITIKAIANITVDAKENTVESEGTIVVPVFSVNASTATVDLSKYTSINQLTFPGITTSAKSIKFEVSVTEVNISRINPSVFQEIVVNNMGEIQEILKALFAK